MYNHNAPYECMREEGKLDSERFDDVTLLTLKMKEEDISQEIYIGSRC